MGLPVPPPVNRIPVELLIEILMLCLNETWHRSWAISSASFALNATAEYNPFIFGQVCSHWRNVASTTPALWATVTLYEPKMSQVPLYELWLERASECPLTLASFTRRPQTWKRVDFWLQGAAFAPLLYLPVGGVPILESATLDLRDWNHEEVDEIWRALHSSPVLQRVVWDPGYLANELPDHIPWAQLTHVRLPEAPSLTQDTFLAILHSCRHLQELCFDSTMSMYTSRPVEPVMLPHLRMLRTRAFDLSPDFNLHYMILPSLVSLEFTIFVNRDPFQFIPALLTRFSCKLQELTLRHGSWWIEETLLPFLAVPLIQDLRKLDLSSGNVTDKTIRALTLDPTKEGGLLPHLRELVLPMFHTSVKISAASTMAEMLGSRESTLRTFEVTIPYKDIKRHTTDYKFKEIMRRPWQLCRRSFSVDGVQLGLYAC
ncbi:hypothetical protein Hypma_013667 [Hypsizygus marmoreus]|uniref:Uncharacterized protein n=1 Tax=Hypsizygus marmoreus TaxID=39966 RepID=A0A369JCA9_HYPMA|nr:hypothetical protein Hypma_013667 [Hypsizygus marmoreus]